MGRVFRSLAPNSLQACLYLATAWAIGGGCRRVYSQLPEYGQRGDTPHAASKEQGAFEVFFPEGSKAMQAGFILFDSVHDSMKSV